MTFYSFNRFSKAACIFLGVVIASVSAFYGLIIFWPQDNPYDEVKVEIPKGASLSEISQHLVDRHILSNEKAFLLAVKTLGYETEFPAGSFTIRKARTNFHIIDQLIRGKPELKKVTLLEGWTVEQVANVLSDELGVSKEKMLQYCYDEQFVMKLKASASNLEGFLFPETYYFFVGEEPKVILARLVEEYNNLITDEIRARIAELGYTESEIITLASIIQGEAIYDAERPIISAVFHNRLKRGMKLQADPTIQYLIEDGPRRLLNRDLKIDSPYNTYLYPGLPPNPINNPGKASILAALYPEDNDYLYFVARGDGYHTFSRTQNEHNIAKKKFQRVRRNVRQARQNGSD